ncbi:MAG: hypothetical protein FWC97_00475 [Treponema sp.]|nr:hypothetical protein [Treponema sp.]
MNSKITELTVATKRMLCELVEKSDEDYKKIESAQRCFDDAVKALRTLELSDLCASSGEEQQKLIVSQQQVRECYAKLKRVLLEIYKDIFNSIKEKM